MKATDGLGDWLKEDDLYVAGRQDWNPLLPATYGQKTCYLPQVEKWAGLAEAMREQKEIHVFRRLPMKKEKGLTWPDTYVCCDWARPS
jgi:hypothetical protein